MKPSWESIRLSSILCCTMSTLATILACQSGPTWAGIVFAILTGMFLSAHAYIHLLIDMRSQIDILLNANRAMKELNAHLIADKVLVTIHEQSDGKIELARPSIH
jgi:hypothetical protein